jgi:undecaprenyl diphosphate synthase
MPRDAHAALGRTRHWTCQQASVRAQQPRPSDRPTHVAIIMDGNGRWAQMRGLPRQEGHRRGLEALRRTVKNAGELGIQILTLYSFSTENWRRPQAESPS